MSLTCHESPCDGDYPGTTVEDWIEHRMIVHHEQPIHIDLRPPTDHPCDARDVDEAEALGAAIALVRDRFGGKATVVATDAADPKAFTGIG